MPLFHRHAAAVAPLATKLDTDHRWRSYGFNHADIAPLRLQARPLLDVQLYESGDGAEVINFSPVSIRLQQEVLLG